MIHETHMYRRLVLATGMATLIVMSACSVEHPASGRSAEQEDTESETLEEVFEDPVEKTDEVQDMIEPETTESVSEPERSDPGTELLVTTEWLAAHAQDEGLRIVDTRKAAEYQAGHLPGAVSIPRSATFDPQKQSTVGQPAAIADLFGSRGIDESVHVVLYDEGKSTAAARVFWTLELYGHPHVSVLDGGLVKWQAEGRELTGAEPTVTPTTFIPRPTDLTATLDHVLEGIDEDATIALDTRSDDEWNDGRVPGAVHIEWTNNFTEGEIPVYKSLEELTALYEGAGITKDHRVHTY